MIRWPLHLLSVVVVAFAVLAPVRADAQFALPFASSRSLVPSAEDGLPIEKKLQRSVKNAVRGVRRAVRRSLYMQKYGPTWWWKWTRRAAVPVAFALLVLLADPGLLTTWKEEGLAAFATYALLSVYVYVRLLLSSQVRLAVRFAVLVSLVYGVWRADLIPDRFLTQIIPCRIDDFLLIAVAVRLFVYACPEEAVALHAQRAMTFWRRFLAARRGVDPAVAPEGREPMRRGRRRTDPARS